MNDIFLAARVTKALYGALIRAPSNTLRVSPRDFAGGIAVDVVVEVIRNYKGTPDMSLTVTPEGDGTFTLSW